MVARTCWSSSTTRIMSALQARGENRAAAPPVPRISLGGLGNLADAVVKALKGVREAVIDDGAAAAAGGRRNPPGRARHRRQGTLAGAGTLDHRLLEPFAGIGAVE